MATNLQFIKSVSGTSVSSLSVTDCFSDKYDVYQITVVESDTSGTGWQKINFIDSGGIDTTANYDYANLQLLTYAGFGENRYTNQTNFPLIWYQDENPTDFGGFTGYVFNPYDSSSYTFALSQNTFHTTSGLGSNKFIGVHKVAETIRGINLSSTETMNAVEISVYGVK